MHIVLMEVIQSDLCASAVVSPSQETVHWRLELAQYSGRPLRILCSVRGNQEQSNYARSNNGKVTVLMPPLQSPATVPAPVAFTCLPDRCCVCTAPVLTDVYHRCMHGASCSGFGFITYINPADSERVVANAAQDVYSLDGRKVCMHSLWQTAWSN